MAQSHVDRLKDAGLIREEDASCMSEDHKSKINGLSSEAVDGLIQAKQELSGDGDSSSDDGGVALFF